MADWLDLVEPCTAEEAHRVLIGLGFAPNFASASDRSVSLVRDNEDDSYTVITLPLSGEMPRSLLIRQLHLNGIPFDEFGQGLQAIRAEEEGEGAV